jgi:hypothetical protein
MIKYKECDCDEDFWDEIVVQNDNHYSNKNVIYFHCSCCGEDFRVEDFETGLIVEYAPVQN